MSLGSIILGILVALLKGAASFLGIYSRQKDQATGAELQRGKDAQDELQRIQNAVQAGNDPKLDDLAGVRNDEANRHDKLS